MKSKCKTSLSTKTPSDQRAPSNIRRRRVQTTERARGSGILQSNELHCPQILSDAAKHITLDSKVQTDLEDHEALKKEEEDTLKTTIAPTTIKAQGPEILAINGFPRPMHPPDDMTNTVRVHIFESKGEYKRYNDNNNNKFHPP